MSSGIIGCWLLILVREFSGKRKHGDPIWKRVENGCKLHIILVKFHTELFFEEINGGVFFNVKEKRRSFILQNISLSA